MTKYKTGKNRSDIELDSESTVTVRGYFHKSKNFPPEFPLLKTKTKSPKIGTPGAKYFEGVVKTMNHKCKEYFFDKDIPERLFDVKRIQIFCNQEDKFFSVIIKAAIVNL